MTDFKTRRPPTLVVDKGETPLASPPSSSNGSTMESTESLTYLKEPMSALSAKIKDVATKYSSSLQASLTLFKSFVGSGILALPYAFQQAGVGLSIIMTMIIGFMLGHCFLLLLETTDDAAGKRKVSYPKLASEIIGPKAKSIVEILLMIEQLGCCIGVIIFTKEFLNHILCSFEVESLCNNTYFNLSFSLAIVVPLSLINNMHYFYIPSLAANAFIVIALVAQLVYNFQHWGSDPTASAHLASNAGFHFSKLPLFFGVALYSFEGVGVTLSIRDTMEKPEELPGLIKKQMIGLTATYIIFSGVSALALGSHLSDIVFFSLPTTQPFYLLIQILYAISALISYPIQLFPVLRIIENSKGLRTRIFTEKGKEKNKMLRYGVRLAIIALVFLIAYTAKSFHLFLNLMGSVVFTCLGFGLPIWLYMKHFKGRMEKRVKITNIIILVFSLVFGGIGFIMSMKEMF